MPKRPSPIAGLLAAYRSGQADPVTEARAALSRANGNASRNTYLTRDPAWTLAEAERQSERGEGSLTLSGVPVSLKDCFDLQEFTTSCGARFYASRNQKARSDSWVAAQLRRCGAVITGKSHLHQLAYGITGENPDYGDCLQPADSEVLTGGSSSGAAASIQEGSALAAIGTDTGGSVRAPAALCGLTGYRASLGIGDWSGGYHLAPSFDTIGWLCRDLRDLPLLASALFELPAGSQIAAEPRVGVLKGALPEACDSRVRGALAVWKARLEQAGAHLAPFEAPFWQEAWDIYAPIQAFEAAELHRGFFDEFDPPIAARLHWGASLTDDEIADLRRRHAGFQREQELLFQQFDFVLAPISPMSRLIAGADHTETRALILRLTTPASLGGNPAIVLSSTDCGVQLIAARGNDRQLLRFAAVLGEQIAADEN